MDQTRLEKEKLDLNDPKLKHFSKIHLKRLKQSGLCIEAFKSRLFEKIESKITEKEFRSLYLDEKEPLSLEIIGKEKGINRIDFSLWAKEKLHIKIRGTKREIKLSPQFIQRYQNGESAHALSKELKITTKEFLKVLKQAGVKKRGYRESMELRAALSPVPPEYIQRYQNGESIQALSKELKISSWKFEKALEGAGVEKRGVKEAVITRYKREGKDDGISPDYVERYQNGESATSLSQELGISTRLFFKGLIQAGIKKRERKEAIQLHYSRIPKTQISQKYIQRYENGESAEVLSQELGISAKVFRKRLRENSIEMHKPFQKTKLPPEYIQRYQNGESGYKLSQELGISTNAFLRALERAEIKKRGYEDAITIYHELLRIEVSSEYIQRYQKGESATTLSQELGISRKAFLKAIDRNEEVERRCHEEAMDFFKDLVPLEFLERYEKGENPETLAKELSIGLKSFIKCAIVLTNEWKKWQNITELIAKELDPNAVFQSIHDWGIPDIKFTEANLKKIADAKINGEELGDTVKKYAPQCDVLEIWCLRNPQKNFVHKDPKTQKRTQVLFYTPQQLIARIKDNKKRVRLKNELIETFLIIIPDLESFFEDYD